MIHQVRELHVRREARARYGAGEALFTLSGNAVLPNLRAVRDLAAAMTAARRAAGEADPVVAPGSLNAMGLIDEILHAVVAVYREHEDPEAVDDALDHLDEVLGTEAVDEVLLRFTADFPPLVVHRGAVTPEDYLAGETAGTPNREIALEELAACWLENVNPAFLPYRELFDDRSLAAATAYRPVVEELGRFFAGRAPFGPDSQDLVTMLRAPARAEPASLAGQLRWIRVHWGSFLAAYLGDQFAALLDRLVTGLDVAAEEERALWMRHHPSPGGAGSAQAPTYGGLDAEPERFSEDKDWMPHVVLMAKSTYVWLDQLSRRYGREIRRLDQIPDEELDRLARWGFTGLWLIGLWERSRASPTDQAAAAATPTPSRPPIRCSTTRSPPTWAGRPPGRPCAIARGPAASASPADMVPNHMGIDSRWVIEHPDWFLARPDSPYPGYTLQRARPVRRPAGRDPDRGPLLGFAATPPSSSSREDRWTGDVRYVYHGNDGTSMPWNDTAQLDYLKAEVREAVIQTILAVARRFPIIRFDAAMTLAKKHFQRLWFPEPGHGRRHPLARRVRHDEGGLRRRDARRVLARGRGPRGRRGAGHAAPRRGVLAHGGLLRPDARHAPRLQQRLHEHAARRGERQVPDPDQEHPRVRSGDPQALRQLHEQSGREDRRRAVRHRRQVLRRSPRSWPRCPASRCSATGRSRASPRSTAWSTGAPTGTNVPTRALVARHEWQLFPLLHRRRLFAEVRDFRFYDVVDDAGHVNEDVLAYSNRAGADRSLVIYHNRFASMRGRLRDFVAFAVKDQSGTKHLVRTSVADGLGLHERPGGGGRLPRRRGWPGVRPRDRRPPRSRPARGAGGLRGPRSARLARDRRRRGSGVPGHGRGPRGRRRSQRGGRARGAPPAAAPRRRGDPGQRRPGARGDGGVGGSSRRRGPRRVRRPGVTGVPGAPGVPSATSRRGTHRRAHGGVLGRPDVADARGTGPATPSAGPRRARRRVAGAGGRRPSSRPLDRAPDRPGHRDCGARGALRHAAPGRLRRSARCPADDSAGIRRRPCRPGRCLRRGRPVARRTDVGRPAGLARCRGDRRGPGARSRGPRVARLVRPGPSRAGSSPTRTAGAAWTKARPGGPSRRCAT